MFSSKSTPRPSLPCFYEPFLCCLYSLSKTTKLILLDSLLQEVCISSGSDGSLALSSLRLSVCLSQSQTYFFGAKESPLNIGENLRETQLDPHHPISPHCTLPSLLLWIYQFSPRDGSRANSRSTIYVFNALLENSAKKWYTCLVSIFPTWALATHSRR